MDTSQMGRIPLPPHWELSLIKLQIHIIPFCIMKISLQNILKILNWKKENSYFVQNPYSLLSDGLASLLIFLQYLPVCSSSFDSTCTQPLA